MSSFDIQNDSVVISRAEYASLKDDELWRRCVENAGVDNWDGFSYAMEEYYGAGEDDE